MVRLREPVSSAEIQGQGGVSPLEKVIRLCIWRYYKKTFFAELSGLHHELFYHTDEISNGYLAS